MRVAEVFVQGVRAGLFTEDHEADTPYTFEYGEHYNGPPISLMLPIEKKKFVFKRFPSFFDGLLPEGFQLEALLKNRRIDADDYFSQLLILGDDLIGDVTVREKK